MNAFKPLSLCALRCSIQFSFLYVQQQGDSEEEGRFSFLDVEAVRVDQIF